MRAFVVAAAFFIDYKDIGLVLVEGWEEVDYTITLVDTGVFDVFDALHHKEALLLWEHRLAMLILQESGVGAYTDIKIAIL